MNRETIESFISIVHCQTTSAAAKALFVSQSTISHRIQILEQELGLTLFHRERGFKKMELTEDGKKFYPLALQWIDLNTQMHQIHAGASLGKVRIGSMDSINQYILPPIISSIKDTQPNLQLEFVSYHSQEIYSRLTTQQLDVGFAFYPIRYNITAVPVFSEPMYMVCRPGSGYPDGAVHPASLEKKKEIYFAWDDNIARWNSEWWDDQEPPYVTVDSCALVKTFLTKPGLWAICPASVAASFRASYGMEIHPFTKAAPRRVCYMLLRKYPRESGKPPAVEVFVDSFNQLLENHPWRYVNE